MLFLTGNAVNYAIQYTVLLVYILMMIAVAFYTRKKSKTLNDFFLAGRGLGGVMSAFAYGTTYFSSVVFIGYAGKFGWNMGLSVLYIALGNALIGAFIAWKVLAKRTRNITHFLGAKTMPEFFEKRYQSKHLKLFSAIIIFVFLIPYSASVYQGIAYLFESVFNIPFIWCVIIMASLTALYLFFGGYFATALSDFIQGIIMLVGVFLMVIFCLNNEAVNWGEGLSRLVNEYSLGFAPSSEGGLDSPLLNVIILTLLTSFGMWGLPQSVHKFYAVKDDGAIKKATWVSSLFCLIIGGGAYFVGSLCKLYLTEVPQANYDMIVPIMLEQALPAAMLGLIVVLILSASMSTLSSLSLSASSSVSVDIFKGYIKKDADDKKVNWIMRGFCLLFILVSVLLAVFQIDAIVTLMSLSWGTLAGCFIGPYVYGLYSKKVTKASCYASLISGLLLTFILIFVFGAVSPANGVADFQGIVKGGVARSPLIGVITMAFSMIIVPIVSLFTKKPDKEFIDNLFSQNTIGTEVVDFKDNSQKSTEDAAVFQSTEKENPSGNGSPASESETEKEVTEKNLSEKEDALKFDLNVNDLNAEVDKDTKDIEDNFQDKTKGSENKGSSNKNNYLKEIYRKIKTKLKFSKNKNDKR